MAVRFLDFVADPLVARSGLHKDALRRSKPRTTALLWKVLPQPAVVAARADRLAFARSGRMLECHQPAPKRRTFHRQSPVPHPKPSSPPAGPRTKLRQRQFQRTLALYSAGSGYPLLPAAAVRPSAGQENAL